MMIILPGEIGFGFLVISNLLVSKASPIIEFAVCWIQLNCRGQYANRPNILPIPVSLTGLLTQGFFLPRTRTEPRARRVLGRSSSPPIRFLWELAAVNGPSFQADYLGLKIFGGLFEPLK